MSLFERGGLNRKISAELKTSLSLCNGLAKPFVMMRLLTYSQPLNFLFLY